MLGSFDEDVIRSLKLSLSQGGLNSANIVYLNDKNLDIELLEKVQYLENLILCLFKSKLGESPFMSDLALIGQVEVFESSDPYYKLPYPGFLIHCTYKYKLDPRASCVFASTLSDSNELGYCALSCGFKLKSLL